MNSELSRRRPNLRTRTGLAILLAECAFLAATALRADGAAAVRSEIALAERTLGRAWTIEALANANRMFDEAARRMTVAMPSRQRICGAPDCAAATVPLAIFVYRLVLRLSWIASVPVPLWPVIVAMCIDGGCCRRAGPQDPQRAIVERRVVRRLVRWCCALLIVALQLPVAIPPLVVVAAAGACLAATFLALRMRGPPIS